MNEILLTGTLSLNSNNQSMNQNTLEPPSEACIVILAIHHCYSKGLLLGPTGFCQDKSETLLGSVLALSSTVIFWNELNINL